MLIKYQLLIFVLGHFKNEYKSYIRIDHKFKKTWSWMLKINMHNLRQYSYLRHTDSEMMRDYR